MDLVLQNHPDFFSNELTHLLFARTVCFTASTNCSTEGAGMHILSAPVCILKAFSSGRNNKMDPSGFLYAFRPSNNPYKSESPHHFTATEENLCLQKVIFP